PGRAVRRRAAAEDQLQLRLRGRGAAGGRVAFEGGVGRVVHRRRRPRTLRRATRRELVMTETIAEMVLPGTYIEVRAEGLIGAGATAPGTIGVAATAPRGAANTVRSLGSSSDALDMFGLYGAYANGDAPPYTLVRSLEQIFIGGGQNVFAVRIANGTPATA